MHISAGILAPSVLAGGYVVAGSLAAIGLRRIRDRDYPLVGVMTAAFFVAGFVRVPVPPSSVHLTLNSLLGITLGLQCFPAIFIALLLQAVLLGHGGLTTLGVNMVMMAVPGYLAGAWMRWGLRHNSSGRIPFALVLGLTMITAPKMLADAMHHAGWIHATLSWPQAVILGLVATAAATLYDRLHKGNAMFRWGFAAGGLAMLMSAGLLFVILGFAPLDRMSQRDALRDLARFAFVAHTPIVLVEAVIVGMVMRYLAVVRPSLLNKD